MQPRIPFLDRQRELVTIADGAVWLKHWLGVDQQCALLDQCNAVMNGPAGGYVPDVRGGGKMHVRMVCLGRHWNALTYTYESTRTDHDHAPVAPVPAEWVRLASRAAAEAGFTFAPDLCIMNWYDVDGRMGLHQDKDEGRESIEAGLPVVSISLGDTARFLFGGLRRREPIQSLLLESGDIFVFGGVARLRYHGVSRIIAGTAPPELGNKWGRESFFDDRSSKNDSRPHFEGRFNLTFRKY